MKKSFRFLSLILALVMCAALCVPAFAVEPNTQNDFPWSIDECEIVIPNTAVPTLEGEDTVYYDFFDETTGFYYDFYNATQNTFFRWKDGPSNQNSGISTHEDGASKILYTKYEFSVQKSWVDGASNGRKFVINSSSVRVSGGSYLYNEKTQQNDYSNTNGSYKFIICNDKLQSPVLLEKTISSCTDYLYFAFPTPGDTYYIQVKPITLPSNCFLKGSGEIYSYKL